MILKYYSDVTHYLGYYSHIYLPLNAGDNFALVSEGTTRDASRGLFRLSSRFCLNRRSANLNEKWNINKTSI